MTSPRILLGLISAHHPSRWAYRDRARREYLKDSPLDYKFVFGVTPCEDWPYETLSDELQFNVPDTREFMVMKNQMLFGYALNKGYDYCFRACDDTWLFPDRILRAGLEPYDYAGNCPCKFNINGVEKCWMPFYDFFHGGCGIWLSRKAMEILVADEWKGPETHFPPFVECPPSHLPPNPPPPHLVGRLVDRGSAEGPPPPRSPFEVSAPFVLRRPGVEGVRRLWPLPQRQPP